MSSPALSLGRPRGNRDHWAQSLFGVLMYGAVALAFIALAALLIDITDQGAGRVSSQLFTEQPSKIRPEASGIQSAILGTVYLMGICAFFVIPIGVATAVYLEEYADRTKWWNRLIEVNIQNLAAVP